ncbi:MAG: protocatechuate 3,4-dioxygenase [Deltaproteobacteria bacterium]|nr:protocatechuate 3,4-dioxygenase [Deltaproteobacteria bacterium]
MVRLLAGIGLLPLLPELRRGGIRLSSAAAATDWASGGTAAMTGKASYPDPFTAMADACELVATTTQGPCTTATDLLRGDVSEGWSGLPVRLALKLVDATCQPVAGATVKIWHTNIEGSYSGQTPNNGLCLQQQAYASQDFFRGAQTTADDGTVFFDTCFPGWYSGRAIHIHFQVKQGDTSYRISQLFFPEDVTTDIFANHPEYAPYGPPNTTLANDGISAAIPSAQLARHILSVARMADGAMLASKVVTVISQAPTPAVTPTASQAGTATPTPTATPTAVSTPAGCAGDCSGDGSVGVDEVVRGVNIALGNGELSACPAFDADGNGAVAIDDLIAAVNAALNGCR